MTGVYERALAAAADDLHPQVRERYSLSPDDEVATVGSGLMDITRGALALPVLAVMPARNLLFPESGTDVPFTVTTAGYRTAAGHEALTTVREFDFGDRCRRFDSLTVWDDANGRLLDFLGTGGHVVSELQPRVEDGALVVAGGRQWVRLAGRYVRLPWPLAVDVTVRDRYDPAGECFEVTATVESALAGHVLGYRGTFTQEQREMTAVPADLRPTEDIGTLPPR